VPEVPVRFGLTEVIGQGKTDGNKIRVSFVEAACSEGHSFCFAVL
jgi:hypothetical protein